VQALGGGIMVLIENEPLTDVQKQWLDKIGFFQAEVIESQPTEWDGKHMEHKHLDKPIITQSDQSDEKISAPQH